MRQVLRPGALGYERADNVFRVERETKQNDSSVIFIDHVHVYIQSGRMHPREASVAKGVDREERSNRWAVAKVATACMVRECGDSPN